MKIYNLVYEENSDARCGAEVETFLDAEQASRQMREAFYKAIGVLGMSDHEDGDDYSSDIGSMSAGITNGMDTFRWSIDEVDLDIKVAVRVEGGLVQSVYSNAGVDVQVFDLDMSDFPDKGEYEAMQMVEDDLKQLIESPGWNMVW